VSLSNCMYIDRLSTFALLQIVIIGWIRRFPTQRQALIIRYFDASPWAAHWATVLGKVINFRCQQLDYSLADVRDEQGACPQIQVYTEDALKVSCEFSRKVLEPHSFVRRMTKHFTQERLLIFLRQQAVRRISSELLRTNVVAWFHRIRDEHDSTGPGFFVAHSPWYCFVEAYAAERGVRLHSYTDLPMLNLRSLRTRVVIARRIFLRLPNRLVRRRRPQPHDTSVAGQGRVAGPTVLVPIDGNGLSLDGRENSDFFWISSSGLDRGQILAYAYRRDFPLDEGNIQILEKAQIRYVARTKAV